MKKNNNKISSGTILKIVGILSIFFVASLVSANIFDLGRPSEEIRKYQLSNFRGNCIDAEVKDKVIFPYEESLFETTYKTYVEAQYIIENTIATELYQNRKIREYTNQYNKEPATVMDNRNWQYTIQYKGEDVWSVRRSDKNVRTIFLPPSGNEQEMTSSECARELTRLEYLEIQCNTNILCWIVGNGAFNIPSKPALPRSLWWSNSLISSIMPSNTPTPTIAPTQTPQTNNSIDTGVTNVTVVQQGNSDTDYLQQYQNESKQRCQDEINKYTTCMAEYNSKMNDYNSCVTEKLTNEYKYCYKPSNLCGYKPFCAY